MCTDYTVYSPKPNTHSAASSGDMATHTNKMFHCMYDTIFISRILSELCHCFSLGAAVVFSCFPQSVSAGLWEVFWEEVLPDVQKGAVWDTGDPRCSAPLQTPVCHQVHALNQKLKKRNEYNILCFSNCMERTVRIHHQWRQGNFIHIAHFIISKVNLLYIKMMKLLTS